MAITLDLIDSGEISETEDGYEETRVAMITGITGPGHKLKYNALQHPGLPLFGDPHPSIPGIVCVRRVAELVGGNDKAKVTLTYAIPKPSQQQTPPQQPGAPSGNTGVIRVGSSTQSTTTQKDVFGTPILVKHTFPKNYPDESFAGKVDYPQGADVDVAIPNMVVTETRLESASPFFKAQRFVGRVNNRSVFGGQPRTYLCTRIEGVTNDRGLTFEVSYEFQFNPATWDATVVFRDPATGRPVENPIQGKGLQTFRVYPEDDFNLLGLSI